MPLTRGKMRTEHERKIKKNLIDLKKDMDAKDLIDWFIQEEIFDFADSDTINSYNPNTTSNRNNAFFRLLFDSGPKAYSVFLKALEKNGQSHLAELVENTVLVGGESDLGDDHSWIAQIPEQTRTKRLNDRDISKLAQSLGGEWEFIMYDLGLKKQDIEHAKMENPHTVTMQIYSCLNKWKNRAVNAANLDNFLKACISCQSATVDWERVKRIIQQINL